MYEHDLIHRAELRSVKGRDNLVNRVGEAHIGILDDRVHLYRLTGRAVGIASSFFIGRFGISGLRVSRLVLRGLSLCGLVLGGLRFRGFLRRGLFGCRLSNLGNSGLGGFVALVYGTAARQH